jgi:hypothetical protein
MDLHVTIPMVIIILLNHISLTEINFIEILYANNNGNIKKTLTPCN